MTGEPQRVIHDVSVVTMIKVVLVLIAFWLLFLVRDILIIFFVSLILASLITPLAERLEKQKVPRALTVLLVYVVIVIALFLVMAALVPPVLEEVRSLLTRFSAIWERFLGSSGALSTYLQARGYEDSFQRSLDSVTGQIPSVALGAFSSITGVIGSIFSAVLIFVLGFYMVVEAESLKKLIKSLAPSRYQSFIIGSLTRVHAKIGAWMRAQLILSAVMALVVYLMMILLGMPYALILGLLSGLLEFVPYAGPVIAAVPAVLIALAISPVKAALVLLTYVLIHQLEGHVLIPNITKKIVGLNPVVSIMALLLGARLAGFLGVLIAIPLAASLTMLVDEWLADRDLAVQSDV